MSKQVKTVGDAVDMLKGFDATQLRMIFELTLEEATAEAAMAPDYGGKDETVAVLHIMYCRVKALSAEAADPTTEIGAAQARLTERDRAAVARWRAREEARKVADTAARKAARLEAAAAEARKVAEEAAAATK